MKDLGEAKYILGMQIQRDRRRRLLQIDQKRFIKRILEKHKGTDTRVFSIPMQAGQKLNKHEGECDSTERTRFQQMVGSLLHIAQFMSNPGPLHFEAINCILGCLQGLGCNSRIGGMLKVWVCQDRRRYQTRFKLLESLLVPTQTAFSRSSGRTVGGQRAGNLREPFNEPPVVTCKVDE